MKNIKTPQMPKKRGRPPKSKVIIDERPCSIISLLEQQEKGADDFLVVRQCANPSWVVVKMDGMGVPVKIPKKMQNKLVGKRIKVCLISCRPEDYYEYVP